MTWFQPHSGRIAPRRLLVALTFLGCLFPAACSGPDPNGDVSGSVFIVTAGAGAYKLALVKIYFCDETDLRDDLKSVSDDFAKQTKEKLSAATQAGTESEAAKNALAAASAKLEAANAEQKKWADGTKDLENVQSAVDRLSVGIAKLIQEKRPDLVKSWDGAQQIAGSIMDQLYPQSEKTGVPLEGLVAVFGCVVEGTNNSGKSLQEQINLSVKLGEAIQILQPMSDSLQFVQDTSGLFLGQSDSVIGHAVVGADSGVDPANGASIQSEYETATRASDQAGIYDAIMAGSSHFVEAFNKTHPATGSEKEAYPLSVFREVLKSKDDDAAKLVASSDASVKAATEIQAKASAKFDDLRGQLENLPEIEGKRCLDLVSKAKFVAETDADGLFKIRLPRKGHYVVLASAQRMAGTQEEVYFWIVPFALNEQAAGSITLSNDNELFAKDGGGAKVIDLRSSYSDH